MFKHVTLLSALTGLCILSAFGQRDSTRSMLSHGLGISTEYVQFKEYHNLGMVFGGPQILLSYRLQLDRPKSYFEYEFQFGGAGLFSRDMPGINIHVKPLDLSYLHRIPMSSPVSLYLGGNLQGVYDYQLYPFLNSGQSFWLTRYAIAPSLLCRIPVKRHYLQLRFSNSLAGFASRPPQQLDPYFFSLDPADWIRNANSGFTLGSFNLFNATDLSLSYCISRPRTNYQIGYRFYYTGYFEQPDLHLMGHSIQLYIQFHHRKAS